LNQAALGNTIDTHLQFPLLNHLKRDLIERAYLTAAGNEIASGKMASPESSSALVANAFGMFLERPHLLPPLPGLPEMAWPATVVALEQQIRFPWSGGRHPWLDVFIETDTHIVGIESKRYEPFRSSSTARFSDAFWRDVWDSGMQPFLTLRDRLQDGTAGLPEIDAVQLVKHAFALSAESKRRTHPKVAVLVYLHADPNLWPGGKSIEHARRVRHRCAIERFGSAVAGASVQFSSMTYADICRVWAEGTDLDLKEHAVALCHAFQIA